MTPGELVSELEYDIFKAEKHGGDWKYLYDKDKERIKATALHLVLEGWTK